MSSECNKDGEINQCIRTHPMWSVGLSADTSGLLIYYSWLLVTIAAVPEVKLIRPTHNQQLAAMMRNPVSNYIALLPKFPPAKLFRLCSVGSKANTDKNTIRA